MQEEGEAMEEVMKERREQLSATCAASRRKDALKEKRYEAGDEKRYEPDDKRYEAGDKRLNQDLKKESFLVDHNRRLLYCWNHKAS